MVALNTDNILAQAKRARSIKGTPIPAPLVELLVELSETTTYRFCIGTAGSLSRKKSFFKKNHPSFKFYNKDGKEFEFSEYAKELTHNELFMGINYMENTFEAFVYVYFPFDGAYR